MEIVGESQINQAETDSSVRTSSVPFVKVENIIVKEVASKSELKRFIYLPEAIHKDHSNWVHPIYMDEWEFFNPKKNKSFQSCETILLLAYRDQKVVGRIMGIIHLKYNELHHEKNVRFAFFETWNDDEVASALLRAIESWGREKGMERLIGPLAFSDKDPQGFLIEGFDEPVVIASNCNFPYQVELLEKNGFTKETDLVAYKIDIPYPVPEFYTRIQERVMRNNPGLQVLEFTSRQKVKPYIYEILNLLNLTFSDIIGFTPFSEKEMDDFANRYLFLINPRFIKLVVNERGKVVSFVIGMSHIGDGIRAAKGRLFPFGIFKIFGASRRTKQVNLLLGGIDPAYRGKGLDVMMGVKMFESAHKLGKTTMDSHLELEDNTKVRAEMEKVGGRVYKRFRIFGKKL